VSSRTGIPLPDVGAMPDDRLSGLEQRLRQRVLGQDKAVETVALSLLRSRMGLTGEHRPRGCFLFAGAFTLVNNADQIIIEENLKLLK